MPAISELDSTQLNTIRSGGYAGEIRICVDPSPVVFQCQAAENLTGSVFLSFAWDTPLQGDYQDVEPDMTVLITATADPLELRNPLFRGRAPRVPTASLFYINESSLNLLPGYVVTVLNTYEPLQKDRSGALVDGYLTYQNLPPAVKGLDNFYYGEDATEYQFSFSPTGQAMAQGAAMADYLWTIPGATYDVGSTSTQNITVTVPYGHVWALLDLTDSNGVTNRFKFEILVCLRDDPAFIFEAHGDVSINSEIETGWNASVSYFAGVENLLNRTRLAIVVFDNYKSGAGSFPNVIFTGYLAQEETGISGDVISSTLAETRFEIQSLASLIAQLPVPSLAIRSTATPDAWDEINQPTTQRVIWHLITRYSTFGNLCAIDFVTTDSTWYGGSIDMEASILLESINEVAEEINARLVFFPGGDATLEINANFLSTSDRNALPDLIASGSITVDDLFNYSLPLPYYDTVGQIEAGFASFQTSGAAVVKLSGIAPAVARQEGIESPVILAQLLNASLSQVNAINAAKQRIGDLLEWSNPPILINFTLIDGWRFLTPSTRVWMTFDLSATDSTRGLPVVDTDRYLLLSIGLTWHNDGTFEIGGSARLETQGGNAQVNVSIAPNTVTTDLPVLPALPDYGAFPNDGTQNYLSSDVETDDLQPYGAGDLGQYQPMTTEDAANEADNMPDPDCYIVSPVLNFASGATRNTPFVTVNGSVYTFTIKGSARISTAVWQYLFDSATLPAWVTFPESGGGGPWGHITGTTITSDIRTVDLGGFKDIGGINISIIFPSAVDLTRLKVNQLTGSGIEGSNVTNRFYALYDSDVVLIGEGLFPQQNGAWEVDDTTGWTGVKTIVLQYLFYLTPAVCAWQIAIEGSGLINPFTGEPGDSLTGDAFYQVDSGGVASLYPAYRGFRINSTPVAVPPEYSPNHEYTVLYTGDGNIIPVNFQDDDYSDNQSSPLYVRICGLNAGT